MSTTAGPPTSATATLSLRLFPPLYVSHTLRAQNSGFSAHRVTVRHHSFLVESAGEAEACALEDLQASPGNVSGFFADSALEAKET